LKEWDKPPQQTLQRYRAVAGIGLHQRDVGTLICPSPGFVGQDQVSCATAFFYFDEPFINKWLSILAELGTRCRWPPRSVEIWATDRGQGGRLAEKFGLAAG
jgi:hypothetical protein